MGQQFMGQVTMMGFGFAPRNWALCNGQRMSIQQNAALFSLLGIQYGGDGSTYFQLPNLQGASPVGSGPSVSPGWSPSPYTQGEIAGAETVLLNSGNIPMHTHNLMVSATQAVDSDPLDGELLGASVNPIYAPTQNGVPLGGGPLGSPASAPHPNMQPFLVINMCIALAGVYPSRN